MTAFKILVTCAGGEMAPELIRTLKSSERHDIDVFGVDSDAKAIGRHFADGFATVPYSNDPGYVDAVYALCERWQPDLLWPGADQEAIKLSAERERFESRGWCLACGPAAALKTFGDKIETYKALKDLGIGVPEYYEVKHLEEIDEPLDRILESRGEAVVKPAAGIGGRGVYVIRKGLIGAEAYNGGRELHMDRDLFMQDYLANFSEHLPGLVMGRLVEPVFDIDMLGYNGQPARVGPRRRVVSNMPNEGHIIMDDPQLVALGEAIIRGFDLTWLYDCDVMYGRDGQPNILEINPRPSGSAVFMAMAGYPLFDDMVSIAKGDSLPDIELPVGKVVIPYKALTISPLAADQI
jgi:biotin carboxylase